MENETMEDVAELALENVLSCLIEAQRFLSVLPAEIKNEDGMDWAMAVIRTAKADIVSVLGRKA